jgi:hypothetical protein
VNRSPSSTPDESAAEVVVGTRAPKSEYGPVIFNGRDAAVPMFALSSIARTFTVSPVMPAA